MKYVWPIISVILLVSLIGVLAFFLGKQTANAPTAANITPTITPEENTNEKQTNTAPTTEPTKFLTKTITAGGVLSFSKYSLDLPQGWEMQREQGDNSDKLTLTKLGYKLVIYEAAFGGTGCLFPGDPPSEIAQTFTSFTEIVNPNGYVFRRAIASPNTYTVCQKNNTDGSFGSPTQFGAISFTTPGTPDKNAIVFPEVDAILSSIKK